MGPFRSDWQVVGVVNEWRELTSQKNATWRGHLVKVAALGATFELHVPASLFNAVPVGELVEASGRLEYQSGQLKLVATHLVTLGKDALVRPRAAG